MFSGESALVKGGSMVAMLVTQSSQARSLPVKARQYQRQKEAHPQALSDSHQIST